MDFNLLGQSNSAVQTSMTELYLLWCAWRNRSLHLGFWTSYQCHLIATHPAQNMSLCNIPGAFVRHNVIVNPSPRLSSMVMVHPPALFNISLFVRTNTVYMREGVPHFYAMGEAVIPAGRPPRANVQVQAPAQAQAPRQANDQEGGLPELEAVVAEMVAQNRETRAQVDRLVNMMEELLKTFGGMKPAAEAGPSKPVSQGTGVPRVEADDDDQQEEEDDQESKEDDSEQTDLVPEPETAPRRSQRSLRKPD